MEVKREQLPGTVVVGHAVRSHGLRGEVVVERLSDNPDRFAAGSELLAEINGGRRSLRVRKTRLHHGRLLVSFEGVEDRENADALRGCDLVVPATAVPPAPDGCFYSFELIGCRCRDRTLGELGVVDEVLEDGGGWLLIVAHLDRRLPVPFVQAFLRRVDVTTGVIEVDLPQGLLETCEST
jgi:16S rRNA processing protein RimM